MVAVHRHHGPYDRAVVNGGVVIDVRPAETAEQWCELYGVEVNDGVAVLYKALNDSFVSEHGTSYAPGSTPRAPDWDGGREECGGGLHFSPAPLMALEFAPNAKRLAACPVRVDEIVVHPNGSMPQKVKAPRVCAPCWEVDRYGEAVETRPTPNVSATDAA